MTEKDCEHKEFIEKGVYKCNHLGHPYAKAQQPICHTRFCPTLGLQEGPDLRKMSKR